MHTARARETERVRALIDGLENIRLDAPRSLEHLAGPLRELLGADQVYAYAARRADTSPFELEFVHTSGSPLPEEQVRSGMDALVRGGRPRWGFFDPERPEGDQQNRALVVPIPGSPDAVRAKLKMPPELRRLGVRRRREWDSIADEVAQASAAMFRRLKLHDQSQLRVLVCEGGKLLAWVGAFRHPDRPFDLRERRVLQALTPVLRRRLAHERLLGVNGPRALAFDAALEAIPSPTFLLDHAGAVLHANAAGEAAMDRDPSIRGTLRELRWADASARGFRVSRFSAPGLPPCTLAIRARAETDPGTLVPYFARAWGLTPKQAEVLALVAAGESNRSIGVALESSERTVEHHVTQLLEKAEVDSRAALVAKFWRTAARAS